jgi:1-acyl-sn-glycerol-3-phosphate acyltransferase
MPDKMYRISRAYITFALKTMSGWKVEGRENVPPRGPLIVVANHLSNMDPPLLMCSVPRRLRFLAKKGLFVPGIAQFLTAYGAYPVSLDATQDIKGFNWARRLLTREDGVLCLFPEGRRSFERKMVKAIPGVALLALRTQAPILPIAITGTEHIGPIWRVFFPTGPIRVRIGTPFTLPNVEGRLTREQLDAFTTMVMRRVADMLPPQYQGYYAPGARVPTARTQGAPQ